MRIGLDVRLLGENRRGFERYIRGLLDGIAASPADHEFLLYAYRESVADEIPRDPRIRVRIVPLRGHTFLWTNVALPAAAREDRLDLIHFPASSIWFRGGADLPPAVVTLHDISPALIPEAAPRSRAMRWYVRRLYRAISGRAAAVITDSEASRRDIERVLGIPKGRLHAIPLGVSPSFHPPAAAGGDGLPAPGGIPSPYFLYVGALDRRKNVAGLLEGFRAFVERSGLPHALVLTGHTIPSAGARYDRPEEHLQGFPHPGRVRYLGPAGEGDLAALYAGATATLLWSRYEAFGFPIVESYACGTPAIVSDRGSCPEIAGDGALVVALDDPAALGAALERIARDAALRADLARRGLARARLFSWAETARRTIAVYGEAAGMPRAGPEPGAPAPP